MNLSENPKEDYNIIPNSEKYLVEKKYISIHSGDRNVIQYPHSNDFEITLPDSYHNVQSVKLAQWSLPSNYDVISEYKYNNKFIFRIIDPYNPALYEDINELNVEIYNALYENIDNYYIFTLENGFYDPIQMSIAMTNNMNATVTEYINSYLTANNPSILTQFTSGYTDFVVAYNRVGQILYFGNRRDQFTLENDNSMYLEETLIYKKSDISSLKGQLPDFNSWGLPFYLGFNRCLKTSTSSTTSQRFMYGDAVIPGDKGIWLSSKVDSGLVYYVKADFKVNLIGDNIFYLDIPELNYIDQTSPYSLNNYTLTNTATSGEHNKWFARLPVLTTPIGVFFDSSSRAYKYFNPPKDKLRKMRIRLRYHNGEFVQLGLSEFTLFFEIIMLTPQQQSKKETFTATYV